jgi:hypothetical protein
VAQIDFKFSRTGECVSKRSSPAGRRALLTLGRVCIGPERCAETGIRPSSAEVVLGTFDDDRFLGEHAPWHRTGIKLRPSSADEVIQQIPDHGPARCAEA